MNSDFETFLHGFDPSPPSDTTGFGELHGFHVTPEGADNASGDPSLCAFHIHDAGTTIGEPNTDAYWWNQQTASDTCAVVAQQGVLESLLGHDVPQEDIVRVASENGWYVPGEGTSPDCMGNVLEEFGVSIEKGYDYSVGNLYDALLAGNKVLVGLDGNEIWFPEHSPDGVSLNQPGTTGHAVWVTGIASDETGRLCVIVNDSGTPIGRENKIPIDDFLNAWDDCGNFAVITHISTQELA
jgi:hypothetical protein